MRLFLTLEFLLLCVALPTVIITFRLAPYMFFFLWSAAAYCWMVYRIDHHESLKQIWKWKAVTWAQMKIILPRWILCSLAMLVFTWAYDPEKLFNLVLSKPQIIPGLLLLYPILSALPQEFIFCSFFFERYHRFFPTENAKIIASAVVFAFAHMLFINWVAPVFSFIAGLIFAHTYSKTRSLALVTIEHGLYGNSMFLIGLGWYFWHGALSAQGLAH